MLRPATCAQCGAAFTARRAGAKFCSATCRVRTFRASDDDGSGRDVLKTLRGLRMLGKVWPVYANDPTPATYALLVPRAAAVAELNRYRSEPITDTDLGRIMREARVLDHGAPIADLALQKSRARPKHPGNRNRYGSRRNAPMNSMADFDDSPERRSTVSAG